MSLDVSGKQGLANLINRANGTGYTTETLVHQLPAESTFDPDRNTQIVVWHAGSPDVKTTVYYNRLDLAVQFAEIDSEYDVESLEELLEALNAQFEEGGVMLTEDDLEPIDEFPSSGTVTLVAAASSLSWIGEVEVSLDGSDVGPEPDPGEVSAEFGAYEDTVTTGQEDVIVNLALAVIDGVLAEDVEVTIDVINSHVSGTIAVSGSLPNGVTLESADASSITFTVAEGTDVGDYPIAIAFDVTNNVEEDSVELSVSVAGDEVDTLTISIAND